MKRGSTIFLRAAVILMGLGVLMLCVFALPESFEGEGSGPFLPMIIAIYASALPFYFALYQTMKLLNYIDTNKAFSQLSVKVLKRIKYSAIVIGALYLAILPYFYLIADNEDAPGVLVIGLAFTFGPMVVAGFAAVLQKLLQSAIDIKTENDLTV